MSRPLFLVPTALERERLASLDAPGRLGGPLELCGFGPVAAAARASELLAHGDHSAVLLLGIAGTYEGAPLGTATAFGDVRLDGVGAGEGAAFRTLDFPLVVDAPADADGHTTITDSLPLASDGPTLLTVCAAARGADEVARRRARHPDTAGEDMEAFGVALAARLAGVPLHVVRGWSNAAGDGNVAGWEIDAALAAAVDTAALLREGLR